MISVLPEFHSPLARHSANSKNEDDSGNETAMHESFTITSCILISFGAIVLITSIIYEDMSY
jgi:hypothetical protein